MAKVYKALLTLALTGIVLLTIAGPAFADSSSPMACWNNCGIGGETKTY